MNKLVWLLIGILLLGTGGVLFIYNTYHVLDYREIPLRFSIIEGEIGILTEDQLLDFGNLNPGGSSRKRITVSSPVPARYVVSVTGDARPYVYPEPNQGLLEPDVVQNVSFKVVVPEDIPLGDYSGTVQMRLFRR